MAGKRPRAHGPENCQCFPEVRRGALDGLIVLPSLAQTLNYSTRRTRTTRGFYSSFLYFSGSARRRPDLLFIAATAPDENHLFFKLLAEFFLLTSAKQLI